MAGKLAIAGAVIVAVVLLLVVVGLLGSRPNEEPTPLRSDVIPASATKMTPGTDIYPPILRSDDWLDPVPMPGPVNTAGSEDSPFITPNGTWFFFFWTPDLNIPIQNQLGDKVTGVWWTEKVGGSWTEPEKLILGSRECLDGDEFVDGNTMWFGSVRAGNLGEIDVYTSQYSDGEWGDIENAGQELNVEIDIGAFCFTPDGNTMYYGKGGDIWKIVKSGSSWSTPEKVSNLASVSNKDQPFITADGEELWFTGQSTTGTPGPSLFRCAKSGAGWATPEEIVSQFAGEPNLDADGNLYFVHHYVTTNISLIEADIYVSYRNGSSASSLSESTTDGAGGPGHGISVVLQAAWKMRVQTDN